MSEIIEGRIEKLDVQTGKKADGSSWKRTAVHVHGKIFSTFEDCPYTENTPVKIEYEINGKFNNIKRMMKIPSSDLPQSSAKPTNYVDPRVDIRLQNAVHGISRVYAGTSLSPTDLAKLAKDLVKELYS